MRNQPRPAGAIRSRAATRGASTSARHSALFGMAVLFAIAVLGRVWHLQDVVLERFTIASERTRTALEPIPARDGRILSADGLELAFDRTRFDIAVHYRWVEEPPNAAWLRDQARSRLPPAQRRDADALATAEQQVLADRKRFWESLRTLAGISQAEEARLRGQLQARIERMIASVERRRDERLAESTAASAAETEDRSLPLWERAWRITVRELTTPPARERLDPIILKEELEQHPLLLDVPFPVAAAIQSSPSTYPPAAADVRIHSQRVYPAGDLAAHIVGLRRQSDSQAESAQGPAGSAALPERVGVSGIERAYDSVLRGRPGLRRTVYNSRREVVDSQVLREPVDGQDVSLTFESSLQRRAERILDAALAPAEDAEDSDSSDPPPQGGTLVAIDIETGQIVAAAAAPRVDLSATMRMTADQWQSILDDPRHPLFPRVTQLAAPPGSVYKVLTAVAALESGTVDGATRLHCQGFLDRPDQLRCMIFRQSGASHGDVTLGDALCESCNVFFFQTTRQMGPGPLRLWSERFGFGAPTGADIPGEAEGRLPAPTKSTALQLSIGQSTLLTSPLQVARMMAAIANGGTLVTPRFVQPGSSASAPAAAGIELAGYVRDEAPPPARIPELSPRTLAIIREGLERVVEDARGTGTSVRVPGVRIAGKTGTAETGGGRPDHAWFAGYVPADRPRIAFVVMLEHAGSGGAAAGPAAREFIEALIETGHIRGSRPQAAASAPVARGE
ncbi:MAG: hypothetical protein KF774_04145 [Planctomyces sp.]|nr:hypothetical protein [Planctomyces sp.]